MPEARIAPLEPPYSDAVTAALERIMPAGVAPLVLFRTLAVNERVFLRLMAGGLLDRGSISLREREIVIDRMCARCGAEYEWGVHVAFFGERVGFTAEEIAGTCAADPGASGFTPREQLLLRLVDELQRHGPRERSAVALRAAWSEPQLIELIGLAGFYHLISFTADALRVPLEPYGARFPGHCASPLRTRLPARGRRGGTPVGRIVAGRDPLLRRCHSSGLGPAPAIATVRSRASRLAARCLCTPR